MTRVLPLVWVAGCIVVPRPVTSERTLRAYETPTLVTLRGVTIDSATVSYATVHIEATQARVCRHEVRAVVEKRTRNRLDLAVSNLDGMPDVVLFLVGAFEVVALPTTLLISGIVVVASHDHVETYDTSVRTIASLCPVPAAAHSSTSRCRAARACAWRQTQPARSHIGSRRANPQRA